jgi:hypothetical protein
MVRDCLHLLLYEVLFPLFVLSATFLYFFYYEWVEQGSEIFHQDYRPETEIIRR